MPDQSFTSKLPDQPIGLIALIKELELPVRNPTVRSWTRSGARKTVVTNEAIKEYYPPVYAPSGLIGNLKFALRYEPIDLSVYDALILQNNGRLSQTKRATFPELKDEEILAIEQAVASSQHAPSS